MSVVVEDVHIIYQRLDHVTGTPVVMEEDLRMGGVIAAQGGLGHAVKEVSKIDIGIGSFIHFHSVIKKSLIILQSFRSRDG